MISSKTISSYIQTHFHGPSNQFTQSQSHHISSNFINTHIIKPVISIRKIPNLPPLFVTADDLYMSSSEETLYDLLGISESGTLSDIKRAYKQMALKYHPDVSPPEQVDEYTLRFLKVQEAYETLSDPYCRAIYDGNMVKGFHLGFSGKKGLWSNIRSEEKAQWKKSWQVQVLELKRRTKVNEVKVDKGERVSWGARVRKQQSESCDHGSNQDQ
ncbi:hypothetical protein L6452_42983 [Arctium lappa]|uniref:Uncharacterized protein n=1 Tax=Arctium lappa TaxID=4217 RepID=A0ACB8XJS0_ARCLA|nr:hypothetical protein L6452_42983 [Arctium lappa]